MFRELLVAQVKKQVWELELEQVWELALEQVWEPALEQVWELELEQMWELALEQVWELALEQVWELALEQVWELVLEQVWELACTRHSHCNSPICIFWPTPCSHVFQLCTKTCILLLGLALAPEWVQALAQ